MAKNLLIVESPAKAKTIEGYLGDDFIVKASNGHIRDLPKGNKAIDIENGFKPVYEISSDKKAIVDELKKLAKGNSVWLATDDDREGEAISWHLKEVLELKDPKRIVFREITKNAIQKAIQSPRQIDDNLVNAQQARRVLDRLVGFEVSPVLWKKIRSGLSAGRVQSVAVRLIVERENEIEKFKPESSYKVTAVFLNANGKKISAVLNKRFETEQQAEEFLKKCINAKFEVESVEKKPAKRSPSAPFSTSTLQQEASVKLGMPVSQTMLIAQRLYEAGYITYMRTDSVNLSADAIKAIENQINADYGSEYFHKRIFENKSKNAQEAHEAIRPTDFANRKVHSDWQRLYDLIWRRTVASQMADAKLERTVVTIGISTCKDEKFVATGEILVFDGFLRVYDIQSENEDDEENEESPHLPPIAKGELLHSKTIKAIERFTRPPARYSEASLVRKLEELGIGRPSTYAPIISTIQTRGYVLKESREGTPRPYTLLTLEGDEIIKTTPVEIANSEKNKLFPTSMGVVVNNFLVKHFSQIMDYQFTAKLEEEFDAIAEGKLVWNKMLADFYASFKQNVDSTTTNVERSDIPTQRFLGNDPKTGLPVYVKIGKYGLFAQLGQNQEETGVKPKFANIKKNQLLDTITLEEALELFKLPKQCGEYEGSMITANVGRFGPYLLHNKKFYSLPKDLDPLDVELSQAIEIIEKKRAEEASRIIKTFSEEPELQVINGRYGPYISYKKEAYKIPKGTDAASLSYQDCMELINKELASGKPKRKTSSARKKKS